MHSTHLAQVVSAWHASPPARLCAWKESSPHSTGHNIMTYYPQHFIFVFFCLQPFKRQRSRALAFIATWVKKGYFYITAVCVKTSRRQFGSAVLKELFPDRRRGKAAVSSGTQIAPFCSLPSRELPSCSQFPFSTNPSAWKYFKIFSTPSDFVTRKKPQYRQGNLSVFSVLPHLLPGISHLLWATGTALSSHDPASTCSGQAGASPANQQQSHSRATEHRDGTQRRLTPTGPEQGLRTPLTYITNPDFWIVTLRTAVRYLELQSAGNLHFLWPLLNQFSEAKSTPPVINVMILFKSSLPWRIESSLSVRSLLNKEVTYVDNSCFFILKWLSF